MIKIIKFVKDKNGNVLLYRTQDNFLITSFNPAQNVVGVPAIPNMFKIQSEASFGTNPFVLDYLQVNTGLCDPIITAENFNDFLIELAKKYFFIDNECESQKGEQGIKGDVGLQGEQGIKGDVGAQGIKGEQGIQGIKGDVGFQGEQGLKGDLGNQGVKGEQGIQGAKGDIGLQGIKGDVGVQGLQGSQGIKGDTGTIATSPTFPLSRNTTLSDTHNNGILIVGANITITIPVGLRVDFECNFITRAGMTLTLLLSGVFVINNVGLVMAGSKMCTLKKIGTTNEFILIGEI